MTWLKAMGFGMFFGASCGILLATPVAFTGPKYYFSHNFGDALAVVGMWATGGAICGLVASLVIRMTDLRMSRLPISRKQLLRSRQFWQISFGVLFLAACASLIPFWQTYGSWQTDGLEAIGWPQPFFARGGGPAYSERYHLDSLMIDLGVWITIAVLAAYVVRKGTSRLSVRMLLFLRNALGANKRVH